MHELGIIYNITAQVLEAAKENELTTVEAIVLLVGQNSGVVPAYLHACYPAAVDGTMLENTVLEIKEITANAMCNECNKVFAVAENETGCPVCAGVDCQLISGEEFMIREIRGW